jgi:NADH:ubiquinone oxidoreductase subunit E
MQEQRLDELRRTHELLYEIDYEHTPLQQGYTNKIMRIDLSKPEMTILPVTEEMKKLWIGGKGFDLWLTLKEVNKNTKWDSAENPICFSSGPLGGTISFPGAGKTLVTAISPLTGSVMDSNVGGYFGPYLKFSGFDALILTGVAPDEVIVFLDGVKKKLSIFKAPKESVDSHVLAEEMTYLFAENETERRNIAVVSSGRAAQHTYMGLLNFSFWDWRRKVARLKQAGRGGIGTVFRHKKVKAFVTRAFKEPPSWSIHENKASEMIPKSQSPSGSCTHHIEEVKNIASKWNNDPEYAIEMMQDIQERFRHISEDAIDTLTNVTGTPKAYLYHIATFYKSFSLQEKGENIIQVCMGTACHVKGSANILDSFERILGIQTGDTTSDKKYTLDAVACLGACSIAPVVKVNEQVYGNVQSKDIDKLLEKENARGGKK